MASTPRPVDPTPYVARGHGRETTFQQNQTDWAVVADAVRELAAQVTADIGAEGRPAVRVGMKLRYAPFETRSRSLTLPGPTSEVADVTAAALELLTRFDQTRAVRLVGVRAEMAPPARARLTRPSGGALPRKLRAGAAAHGELHLPMGRSHGGEESCPW